MGYLACFQLLTVENGSTMSTSVHSFLCGSLLIALGWIPRSEITDASFVTIVETFDQIAQYMIH